jgi:Sec-independent protein translocase protein TatA
MTDKEKELAEQILDKVKSMDSSLTEFRKDMNDFSNETRERFSGLNKKLDTIIEKKEVENKEIHELLKSISKNLER